MAWIRQLNQNRLGFFESLSSFSALSKGLFVLLSSTALRQPPLPPAVDQRAVLVNRVLKEAEFRHISLHISRPGTSSLWEHLLYSAHDRPRAAMPIDIRRCCIYIE
jgi:hypothetical protein